MTMLHAKAGRNMQMQEHSPADQATLYVDHADPTVIAPLLSTGIVQGVTTNPTIFRAAHVAAGRQKEHVRRLLDLGPKELHVQVTGRMDDPDALVREGEELASLDPGRIVVKVPALRGGFTAMRRLADQGIPVTATAVYSADQALVAHVAGATFVAPYVGRMFDAGIDVPRELELMERIARAQGFRILVASVRSRAQLRVAIRAGSTRFTLTPALLQAVCEDSLTARDVAAFAADHEAMSP